MFDPLTDPFGLGAGRREVDRALEPYVRRSPDPGFYDGTGVDVFVSPEMQRSHAAVQELSFGFLPIASAYDVAAGRADAEDYALLALALAPPIGKIGKAVSKTFRFTVPLTGKGFAATKQFYKSLITGNVDDALRYLARRLESLGLASSHGALAKMAMFRKTFLGAPLRVQNPIVRRYVATRIVVLERAITFVARSVPTQAGFARRIVIGNLIARLERVLLVQYADELAQVREVDAILRELEIYLAPEIRIVSELGKQLDRIWAPDPPAPGGVTTLWGRHERLIQGTVLEGSVGNRGGINAARKAAIAAGWKPFTKMSAKQKSAFRAALKGKKLRKASRTSSRSRSDVAPITLAPIPLYRNSMEVANLGAIVGA